MTTSEQIKPNGETPISESLPTTEAEPGSSGVGRGMFSRLLRKDMAVEAPITDPVDRLDPGPLEIGKVYRRGRYITSQVSLLVARYIRIRGDLRSLAASEELTPDSKRYKSAWQCGDYLSTAKAQLELRRTNLAICSNALSLAERQLVTLFPRDTLTIRFEMVRQLLLDRSDGSGTDRIGRELKLLEQQPSEEKAARTRLQEGLIAAYQVDEQALLADDLQVTRLRRLLMYMLLALAVLLGVMPFVTIGIADNQRVSNWPVFNLGSEWLTQIVAALGVSTVGAVGGVISGMFGMRDAKATLGDFRTSLLRLSLKPVAGAIAGLIVYLLLSWQVISGVTVSSGGVYVLAAFLAGFSERYFLRIVGEQLRGQQDRRDEKAPKESTRQVIVTAQPIEAPPSAAGQV